MFLLIIALFSGVTACFTPLLAPFIAPCLAVKLETFKSLSFGIIIAWVGCYKGYFAGHGAEGVSRATTESVVLTSVLVLVWDYFLTSVLL